MSRSERMVVFRLQDRDGELYTTAEGDSLTAEDLASISAMALNALLKTEKLPVAVEAHCSAALQAINDALGGTIEPKEPLT